ncbi:MAG: hypothetical protein HQK83_06680 [Fibrobacteria bacterium]|nr:hypothetical protein [Fibrobacteria bacterium]
MQNRFLEHITSLLLVTACMLTVFFFTHNKLDKTEADALPYHYSKANFQFVDFNNSFQKALLSDMLNLYHPGREEDNIRVYNTLSGVAQMDDLEEMQKSHLKESLTGKKLIEIIGMGVKFLFVYLLVMILTYYGVQVIGTWRFIKQKQRPFLSHSSAKNKIKQAALAVLSFISSMFLFSPAYVIAYSIRTEFNTDVLFFVILLGVISNGLLITYANKFYNFLLTESKKGYVETAVAKGLNNNYALSSRDTGISYKSIFHPLGKFKGHVFEHIFKNARFQYLSTLKEQAVFLITGLIIIEMALNIHGHLSYEMLRQLLHKNYDIVIAIILCIFYTVKLTEIVTDILIQRETAKFANQLQPPTPATIRSVP